MLATSPNTGSSSGSSVTSSTAGEAPPLCVGDLQQLQGGREELVVVVEQAVYKDRVHGWPDGVEVQVLAVVLVEELLEVVEEGSRGPS